MSEGLPPMTGKGNIVTDTKADPLREALETFVIPYELWMDSHADDVQVPMARVTFGDIRRAHAALAVAEDVAYFEEHADRFADAHRGLTTPSDEDGANRAARATAENLREAWLAMAMIREAIETLGPVGAVQASEHLDGPTFMHEAGELVKGIRALAEASTPQPPAPLGGEGGDRVVCGLLVQRLIEEL